VLLHFVVFFASRAHGCLTWHWFLARISQALKTGDSTTT
jgi:hypothetical protein